MATRLEGKYPNITATDEGTFKEAFRSARNAGKKTFEWQGEKYTTELKEEATDKRARTSGANRSQRSEGANKRDDIPRGSEEAPKSSGEDTSGPSNLDRVLLGLPVVGGAAAAYGMYRGAKASKEALRAAEKMREASPILRRSGEGVEASKAVARAEMAREPQMLPSREGAMAMRAGSPTTPLRSANVTSDTGRRFTAEQEREAATSAVRGAASRKAIAEARTGRSRAAKEAKDALMKKEKEKASPRSRTREEDKIEYAKGGMAKKKPGYAKGGVVKAMCGASVPAAQKRKK